MPTTQLEAQVRQRGGMVVVDMVGEINAQADDELNKAYADASGASPPAILLNFKDVDYINSTGIALIVGVMTQARQSGIRLMASGLSEHYMRIFEITHLSEFMDVFADEDTAVKDIESGSE